MADICERCHLPHEISKWEDAQGGFANCIDAQKTAMRGLLHKIGKQVACGGCGASMYFVVHNNGKRVPYTEAGLNHFIDCPARDQFKRPRE